MRLSDGRTVEIRPARPEDHDQVVWLYDETPPANPRPRFLGASPQAGRQCHP